MEPVVYEQNFSNLSLMKSKPFFIGGSTCIPQIFGFWGERIINKAFSICLSNKLLFCSYCQCCIPVVLNIDMKNIDCLFWWLLAAYQDHLLDLLQVSERHSGGAITSAEFQSQLTKAEATLQKMQLSIYVTFFEVCYNPSCYPINVTVRNIK